MQMQGFGPDIPLLPDMRLRVEVSATAGPKLQKVPRCGCYDIHTSFGYSGRHQLSGDSEPGIENFNEFFKPFEFTYNEVFLGVWSGKAYKIFSVITCTFLKVDSPGSLYNKLCYSSFPYHGLDFGWKWRSGK